MNLSELRDLIRAEAGIEGNDEQTTLIDAIINQELTQLTGRARYEELRKEHTYTTAADAESLFDLPADFQLFDAISFYRFGDTEVPPYGRILTKGLSMGYRRLAYGSPHFYHILNGKLQVYPYTNILLYDYFTLSYYYKPVLLLDTDSIPVPSIEKAVQQLAMSRMLRMSDTKRAQMAKAEGNEAFVSSRAENVGK